MISFIQFSADESVKEGGRGWFEIWRMGLRGRGVARKAVLVFVRNPPPPLVLCSQSVTKIFSPVILGGILSIIVHISKCELRVEHFG